MGSELPDEVKPRNSLWYDLLVGGGLGLALAALGLLALALVASSGEGPGAGPRGCSLFLGLLAVVAAAVSAGYLLGGIPGAAAGGAAGYLVPFIGYGMYTQRVTGWAAWRLRRPKPGRRG